MSAEKIDVSDFMNLSLECVGAGILPTGKKFFELSECHAMEVAIEFANWWGENSYRDCDKGWYKYYTQTKEFANFTMSTPVYEYFTTEQLYELFNSQSQLKK